MAPPLEVDVTTAAQQLREGALLLDVREPYEVAACAIPGSRHIPMRQIPASLPDLPQDRDILVLCHHGGRSLRVMQFLRANGFARVSNVAGGIDAWALQIDPALPRY
ncbi:MAG: sulfurtransferase [Opitutae bacterium]|nr:sulfurtransferase [Opitutae bacterium]